MLSCPAPERATAILQKIKKRTGQDKQPKRLQEDGDMLRPGQATMTPARGWGPAQARTSNHGTCKKKGTCSGQDKQLPRWQCWWPWLRAMLAGRHVASSPPAP
eukprot:352390-Chlamydomonas_euryale.AAC.2